MPRSLSPTAAAVAAVTLTLLGCSGQASTPLPSGVPTSYASAIDEGLERYPDVGSTGMGDLRWRCPIEDRVVVDGKEHTRSSSTVFAQTLPGVYVVECSFYPPLPVELAYHEAQDEAAYETLVEATRAFEVRGNVQTETSVVVGEREITVVRFEYPSNPAAGTAFEAHHLDPATRSRVTLKVHDSEERSADYDEQHAAEDLAGILTG